MNRLSLSFGCRWEDLLSSQNDDYIIEGILVAGSLQGWQLSVQRNLLEANVLNFIPAYPFEGGSAMVRSGSY